jgi:hypothetical protein
MDVDLNTLDGIIKILERIAEIIGYDDEELEERGIYNRNPDIEELHQILVEDVARYINTMGFVANIHIAEIVRTVLVKLDYNEFKNLSKWNVTQQMYNYVIDFLFGQYMALTE